MDEVDALVDELKKFSTEVAELNPPVKQNLVITFEQTYNLRLPEDYKYTISQVNGFTIMGDEIYGVKGTKYPMSLESVYIREHTAVLYPQPLYLVPFCSDGGGNFYCFDTNQKTLDNRSCAVVFWTSNYQYTDEDRPELVNESFVHFVKEVIIGWTLENYDYDGNEK